MYAKFGPVFRPSDRLSRSSIRDGCYLEQDMSAFARHSVNREGPSSGQIQAQARRSLGFLQAIESTVTNTEADSEYLRAMTNELNRLLGQLSESNHQTVIDPEGRICELLELAADGAQRLHKRVIERRQHARLDSRLEADDGVVECLTGLIAAVADYHNAIENVRDAIATLDALHSPSIGATYTDVDEMFARLTH